MEKWKVLELCDDGTCCCFSPKTSVVFISIISLLASLDVGEGGKRQLGALRHTLTTLFQTANLLALLGSAVVRDDDYDLIYRRKRESAMLLQIYLWYALGFVVLALLLAMADFLFRFREEGLWSLTYFATEVAFLFVTFRCLPLVDLYRKRLDI